MEFFIVIKRFENRPAGFGLSSWDVLVVETSSLSLVKEFLRLKINFISTIIYVYFMELIFGFYFRFNFLVYSDRIFIIACYNFIWNKIAE